MCRSKKDTYILVNESNKGKPYDKLDLKRVARIWFIIKDLLGQKKESSSRKETQLKNLAKNKSSCKTSFSTKSQIEQKIHPLSLFCVTRRSSFRPKLLLLWQYLLFVMMLQHHWHNKQTFYRTHVDSEDSEQCDKTLDNSKFELFPALINVLSHHLGEYLCSRS